MEEFIQKEAETILRIVKRNVDDYGVEDWIGVEGWSLPRIKLSLREVYDRGVIYGAMTRLATDDAKAERS